MKLVRSDLKKVERFKRWPIAFSSKYLILNYKNIGQPSKTLQTESKVWVYDICFGRFQKNPESLASIKWLYPLNQILYPSKIRPQSSNRDVRRFVADLLQRIDADMTNERAWEMAKMFFGKARRVWTGAGNCTVHLQYTDMTAPDATKLKHVAGHRRRRRVPLKRRRGSNILTL